jgi:hypothetical protein
MVKSHYISHAFFTPKITYCPLSLLVNHSALTEWIRYLHLLTKTTIVEVALGALMTTAVAADVEV